MARRLSAHSGIRIVNEVVLNQVLVEVGDASLTADVIARIQTDGTLWLGGSTFHGTPVLRFSVSGWATSEDDIDRSADAIVSAVDAARAAAGGQP
jgi:threonine aldolase